MSSDGTPSFSFNSLASSARQSRESGNWQDVAESSSQAESRSSGGRTTLSQQSAEPGKSSTELRTSVEVPESEPSTNTRHGPRRSGGFMLNTAFGTIPTNNSSGGQVGGNGKRKVQNGQLYVNKRRSGHSRLSEGSYAGGSPLSREVSIGESEQSEPPPLPASRSSGIDPQQLVQMALSISQSRRRHVSNTLQIPQASPRGQRVGSGSASPVYDTVRTSDTIGRTSGRQSSVLRNVSGSLRGQPSPRSDREDESITYDCADVGVDTNEDNVVYTFSAATQARAEKARAYFELANEHRRMLSSLPPLKPDSSAPGNYTIASNNLPGSTYPQITLTESNLRKKYELGRQYNPLQALRNRRTRTTERRPLVEPSGAWSDAEIVKDYVNEVDAAATKPGFRTAHESVRLPLRSNGEPTDAAEPSTTTHSNRRAEVAGSKITKAQSPWSIDPSELLADAYWLEQGDNKLVIENRYGHYIFPQLSPFSVEKSPRSKEIARHDDSIKNVDSDGTKDRGRRKLNLLPVRKHIGTPRKRLSQNRGRSASSSSGSSFSELRKRGSSLDRAHVLDGENIGPLQRHMETMMARDERDELSSPDLVSSDHWESKHTQFPNAKAGPNGKPNGSIETIATQTHHRSRSAEPPGSILEEQPRSSIDDIDAAEPESPVVSNYIPAIGMDLSPPYSRRSTPSRKSKKSRIPFVHLGSKERNHIEYNDFAIDHSKVVDYDISRQASGEVMDDPCSSYDSTRPDQMKRHKTLESLTGSLHRTETSGKRSTKNGSSKESNRTVGRFFKGNRIGVIARSEGSKLGDFIWNKDKPAESANSSTLDVYNQDTDLSDDGDLDGDNGSLKYPPVDRRPDVDSTDVSPRGSFERTRTKPKYYMSNLPVFKSPSASNGHMSAGTLSPGRDHIGRQQAAQRDEGSSRFDQLAPPRIILNNISPLSSPETARSAADGLDLDRRGSDGSLVPWSRSGARNSAVSLGMPGQIGRPGMVRGGGMPMTGSYSYERSPSRPALEGKRHWSISDRAQIEQRAPEHTTRRDIARVKALLLSSGIKAREIQDKADSIQDPPSAILVNAVRTAGQNVKPVMRREEHVIAARILSKDLSASVNELETALSRFEDTTARSLNSQVESLGEKVSEQLAPLVNQMENEADTFLGELTSTKTVSVKAVDDYIDTIFRKRRRQFRVVKRLGFKLLEWLVLVLLWWVWFLVVLFNFAKSIGVGVLRILKWLLWL